MAPLNLDKDAKEMLWRAERLYIREATKVAQNSVIKYERLHSRYHTRTECSPTCTGLMLLNHAKATLASRIATSKRIFWDTVSGQEEI